MPKPIRLTWAVLALLGGLLCTFQSQPARAAGVTEYAMIRFDGMDNSQVVWPDGHVDFISSLVPNANGHPQGFDVRIYALTLLMNKLSQQGWEFVEMYGPDDVLMKRTH
jgi:hypothetical protein